MDRVYQGAARPLFMIKPVKIIAADLECCDSPGRVLDPNAAQVAALAQEKRPDEDVRSLVMLDDYHLPCTEKS
jgi:hypothetical protein